MKKNYLVIVLFAANVTAQQSPGGISSNLQVWMKADAGLSTSGNNITAWKDQSANAYSPAVVGGPPQAGSFINFNPVVKFTGSDVTGGYFRIPTNAPNFSNMNVTTGSAQTEIFTTAFSTRTGNQYSAIVTKNNGGVWDGITLANYNISGTTTNYRTGYAVSDWLSDGGSTSAQQTIDQTPSKIFLLHGGNTQSGSTNTNRLRVNGNTATTNNAAFFNPNSYDFSIGNNSAGGTQYGFEGLIGDVIYYNRNLTAAEAQKVNSYLAIKYGITLAANNQSYTSSNGTDFWTGATGPTATYNNNIFGIARDDAGSIDQRQSQSQNIGIQPIITNGSEGLVTTNKAAPTLSNNLSSSIVGSDTGSTAYITPITGPSGIVVNNRTQRVWLVQEKTGTVGNVTISFPISNTNQKVYLVKSSSLDTTFDATDTWIELTNLTAINGVTYASATIDFADNDLFTFATFKSSPGGVATGISLWNRADAGISPTTGSITTWTDQASGYVASQQGSNATPSVIAGSKTNLNFNPGVNFTTFSQRIGNISVQTVTSLDYDIFNVTKNGVNNNVIFGIARNNTTKDGTNYDSPHFKANGTIAMRDTSGNLIYSGTPGVLPYNTTIPTIGYAQVKNTSISFGQNGTNTTQLGTYGAKGNITGGYYFGRNLDAPLSGDDDGFTGVIGENIVYSRTLTPIERQKVDSYLAIKYGMTLATSAAPMNYLNSASSTNTDNVVWTGVGNTTFYNRVFGIGRDDAGGLDQRISIAADPAAIITLSTDTDFTSQNAPTTTHPAIALDKQFTMMGDNNLSVTAYSTPITIGGKTMNRLPRIWRAQDTGDMGCVNIRMATNVSGNIIPNPGTGSLYAILADDPNFTTNVSLKKINYSATNIDFAINFNANNNNNYFTLAVLPASAVPAPVTGKTVGISTVNDSWQPTTNNTYLELRSQKLGFVISRVTTANRLAMIQQPGLVVYDLEQSKFFVSNGSVWRELGIDNTKSSFCN
ncbi:beta strand repeat-containing protein [Chryseobacterium arthrosphaerae]|uniref:beta strand repeat-containing protein n=1 Tax=Chryseobacterium arthrosphaerae TaxID=651561 RepID=UPI003D32F6CF